MHKFLLLSHLRAVATDSLNGSQGSQRNDTFARFYPAHLLLILSVTDIYKRYMELRGMLMNKKYCHEALLTLTSVREPHCSRALNGVIDTSTGSPSLGMSTLCWFLVMRILCIISIVFMDFLCHLLFCKIKTQLTHLFTLQGVFQEDFLPTRTFSYVLYFFNINENLYFFL